MPLRFRIIFGLLAFMLVGFIAFGACGIQEVKTEPEKTFDSVKTSEPEIKPLEASEVQEDKEGKQITGIIKNNQNKTLEFIEITITYFDNDVIVENDFDLIEKLEPGQKYRFSFPTDFIESYDKYKINIDNLD